MTWQLFRTLPYEAPSSVTYVHTVIWYIITNPANPPALFQWAYSICFTLGDSADHQLSIILVDRGGKKIKLGTLQRRLWQHLYQTHLALCLDTIAAAAFKLCYTSEGLAVGPQGGWVVSTVASQWVKFKKPFPSKSCINNNFQSVGVPQITSLCAKNTEYFERMGVFSAFVLHLPRFATQGFWFATASSLIPRPVISSCFSPLLLSLRQRASVANQFAK